MTGDAYDYGRDTATDSGRQESGETEEIREQIKDTRSRMSDTLDQLGERLNPHNLKEQVKDSIREATVGRVSHMARQARDQVMSAERSLVRTARENPIPAAMIGVGLAWIMLNRRRNGHDGYSASASRLSDYGDDAERYELGSSSIDGEESHGLRHGVERVRDTAAELGDRVKERASELGETIKDTASSVGERTADMARGVGRGTKRMASAVGDTTKRVARSVADGSKRQYKRVEENFYENPLAIGALALAAGLAVGLSMPRTETESRLMGDASERLTDKAKEAVETTKDKVQHVAERVIEEGKRTAGEAMRQEGLTSRA
jgi:gas vesicle protein